MAILYQMLQIYLFLFLKLEHLEYLKVGKGGEKNTFEIWVFMSHFVPELHGVTHW